MENRTGGGNNIAGEMVAKADADGYTLLATPPNIVTANAALYKQLNYDPAALEPVAVMAVGPNVLAVKNTLPANMVADLIALAKGNPGKMSYASQGNGSTIPIGARHRPRTISPVGTWIRCSATSALSCRCIRAGRLPAAYPRLRPYRPPGQHLSAFLVSDG